MNTSHSLLISNSHFLAIRTLRRMFSDIEFPRTLGRLEALVTRRMVLNEKWGEILILITVCNSECFCKLNKTTLKSFFVIHVVCSFTDVL